MLLAELNIRHTRRHMPTRRVAVDDGYLPTSGPAFGGVLIGAVVAEHVAGLDEEQFDALDRLVDARHATALPSRASRCATGCRPTRTGSTSPATGSSAPTSSRDRPARARARPPRAGGPAGDRRDHGGARGSPPSGRTIVFRSSTPRSRRPGVPARGSRGPPPATRAGPGCARHRGRRHRARRPRRPRRAAGRRVARRPVGAALGDGGARAPRRAWHRA